MNTFLKDVLLETLKTTNDISSVIFIVPSKRAGLFLKKTLIELLPNKSFFVPSILSIEEFISSLSRLQSIDHTQTLFEFYQTYLTTHTEENKDDFETFSNWAQTLIYDFNEIDRYCIDAKSFFNYLSRIQDVNHWYLQKEKTELITNYINFWNNLWSYYSHFTQTLIEKKIGYQGLLYREASKHINAYLKKEKRKHIFLGFNALNNAEQHIFQSLLEAGQAEVYWDADAFFMNNSYHEASLFLRNYKYDWNYFENNPFKWIQNNFSNDKNIHLIGVSKNIGQAQTVSSILSQVPTESINKTALILADETLLQPVLSELPATITSVNITMGLPLKEVPLSALFEQLFSFQNKPNEQGIYHKDAIAILKNPYVFRLLGTVSHKLSSLLIKDNLIFIGTEKLIAKSPPEYKNTIQLLFSPWDSAATALSNCQELIYLLKDKIDAQNEALELEYVYHFHLLFNKLVTLQQSYQFLNTIKSLYTIYKDLLNSESLDFIGEPFNGLQLMGMLESRCLDFETVIITSVNEGVLPSGKSINSFIPYDLKQAYQLPTYREKDAIYTYHFYRVIQRAKNVYILYNTENEGLGGGEPSRFTKQLIIDKRPNHTIQEHILSPKVPVIQKQLLTIHKNEAILTKIKEIASSGLSPSALTTYIRNPIDFYYRYVLGIKEINGVEETIASNTLGTVIHNTLENFYKPLEGLILTINHLEQMENNINEEVKKQFIQEYSGLEIQQGKNLLIFEVAKKYIRQFILTEKQTIAQGHQIKIIAIEANLKTRIAIEGLQEPIYIKGKVDRIDRFNNQLRIIDYKTGKVTKSDVVLMDWNQLIKDYKYSKALQILAYAYMYLNTTPNPEQVHAGIVSFKNLKEGFLCFGTKESMRGKINPVIDPEVFKLYHEQLQQLIQELLDPSIPFVEKEV